MHCNTEPNYFSQGKVIAMLRRRLSWLLAMLLLLPVVVPTAASARPTVGGMRFERSVIEVPGHDPRATFTVQVTDATGKARRVRGFPIAFAAPGVTLSQSSATTDRSGQASVTVTAFPSSGEEYVLTATAETDPGITAAAVMRVRSTVAVSISLRLENPDGSSVTSPPPGSTVRIRAAVRDPYGRPVDGQSYPLAPATSDPYLTLTTNGTVTDPWTWDGYEGAYYVNLIVPRVRIDLAVTAWLPREPVTATLTKRIR